MNPRRTEERIPRPHRGADSTVPVDRRPGASFTTKRGLSAQGRSSPSDDLRRPSRKSSPAGSSGVSTGPNYVPNTKSVIKRLAPMTPPRDTGSTQIFPTTPRSSTYKPNLQELGVRASVYRRHTLG